MSKCAIDISCQHPLVTREYAIYTPAMEEMIITICTWLERKATGGFIYGPSRFGKTKTVKWYLKAVIEEKLSYVIPIIIWSRPHSNITEYEFWAMLLKATNFVFLKENRRYGKVYNRFLLIERLITIAKLSNQNCIVLIIDEAHDVTLNEWMWLLGLQNELESEGYRLTVFSVASHQIGYQPDYLSRTGNAHVAARFFGVGAKFNGARSVDEISYILNGYDCDSEWPEKSGTSFLKYFSPSDFDKDLRLSNHAELFWECFKCMLPKELVSGVKHWNVELPMLSVTSTIEILLTQLARGEEWDNTISRKNICAVIESTGFTNLIRLITAPE